jgi:hypothetical protein
MTQSGHSAKAVDFYAKNTLFAALCSTQCRWGEAMKNTDLFAAAFALLAIGGVMAFYEWKRIGAGRPIMGKSQAVVLYWCGYLTFLVMGVTTALAAIVR